MTPAEHNLYNGQTNILKMNACYLSGRGLHGVRRSRDVIVYLTEPGGDVSVAVQLAFFINMKNVSTAMGSTISELLPYGKQTGSPLETA